MGQGPVTGNEGRKETLFSIPLSEAKTVNTVGAYLAGNAIGFTLAKMNNETNSLEYAETFLIGPETCAVLITALMDVCASEAAYALALTLEMLNKTAEKGMKI